MVVQESSVREWAVRFLFMRRLTFRGKQTDVYDNRLREEDAEEAKGRKRQSQRHSISFFIHSKV